MTIQLVQVLKYADCAISAIISNNYDVSSNQQFPKTSNSPALQFYFLQSAFRI